MAGKVKAICLSEKKGTAKIPVEKIEVIENHGFKNDAHAGSWHRQVSLLSYETREEFKKMGSTVEDGAFGENLLISGIDFNEIEIGTRLKIGDVILEITQLGKSCHNHCAIYHQVGKCIMPTNGLFSRVLKGGTIQLNDSVEVLKEKDNRLRVAILTLSDKGSQGQREDLSGPYIQNYFKEKYGRDTVFIPNGVERPVIKNDNEINKKYGLKKNDYILFLGRIVPEKQVKLLIEAYKNLETDKKLVIAGGASHTSDYFNEVKECANGRDDIIFTDFVQGEVLEELYSNAYIYVLPSDLEGMPLSLLEAMSYSNCCLTSDIAECTEVCEENAVYFKKSNKEDLENKLRFLLENENIVKEYKEKAQDYICKKYNWDDITEKTLSLYEK